MRGLCRLRSAVFLKLFLQKFTGKLTDLFYHDSFFILKTKIRRNKTTGTNVFSCRDMRHKQSRQPSWSGQSAQEEVQGGCWGLGRLMEEEEALEEAMLLHGQEAFLPLFSFSLLSSPLPLLFPLLPFLPSPFLFSSPPLR